MTTGMRIATNTPMAIGANEKTRLVKADCLNIAGGWSFLVNLAQRWVDEQPLKGAGSNVWSAALQFESGKPPQKDVFDAPPRIKDG